MLNAKSLDIIIPVCNEEGCLAELISRLLKLKQDLSNLDVSFIFIDDGSKDKSLVILNEQAAKSDFVKVISFSRNFGHQLAVTAGLDHSTADYAVIIDADLQDPPEIIKAMCQKAEEGYQVVYGQRLTRDGETAFKKLTAKFFYKLIKKLCDIDIPENTGDFRLIDKDVVKVLQSMRERHRFLRGMVPWTGFKSAPIFYHREARFAGTTQYPLKKMMRLAKDAIFSFSNTPLKVANFVGFGIVGLGFLGALLMLYLKFMTTFTVPGITAVLLTVIILGGIQIIMLGIIGEYIGRIFEESKNRPLYVIKESKNINQQKNG